MHGPTLLLRRVIERRAILGAGLLALAATSLSGSHSVGAATAAATPSCSSSGLVVWLNTQGNGAAGSTFYRLEFTNLSTRACTLGGYPGVSAVSIGGRQLGRAASRDHSRAPRTVRIARGATATALLRIVNVGNFPRSACRPVTAAGLRVYPPNQGAAKAVPFPFRACSRSGPGFLSVRAVRG
jgi:Protein of unknown function (DUF4232)